MNIPGPTSPVEILGRDRELATLDARLAATAAGEGGTVVVVGAPGLGKTRLARELIVRAEALGAAVLHMRSQALDTVRPFAPLTDALAMMPTPWTEAGAMTRVLPDHPEVAGDRAPGIVDALLDATDEFAPEPVVIVVDDLQWADRATLAAVGLLVAQATTRPLLVVLATRPAEPGSAPNDLLTSALDTGATEITLEPLAERDSLAIASATAGAPIGPQLAGWILRSGGNPLHIIELIRAADADGTLTAAAGGSVELAPGTDEIPPTFRTAVLRQLAGLRPPTLRVLRLAALLGSWCAASDLAVICRCGVTELLDPLDEATRAGILTTGPEVRFAHDLVRDALYLDLPESLRASMHTEAAAALEHSGRSPFLLASQSALADTEGVDAVSHLVDAANEAISVSTTVGVDLLERALALSPEPGPQRWNIATSLLDALALLGRTDRVAELSDDLIATELPPEVRDTVRFHRATTKPGPDGINELEFALAEPDVPGHMRQRIHAALAMRCIQIADIDRAREHAAAALTGPDEATDSYGFALASAALTLLALADAHLDEASEWARRCQHHANEPEGRRFTRFDPEFLLGLVAYERDDLDVARGYYEHGADRAARDGRAFFLPAHEMGLESLDYVMGRWDDAVVHRELATGAAHRAGDRYQIGLAHALGARIELHQGRIDEARASIDLAAAIYRNDGPDLGFDATLWVYALLAEQDGDEKTAEEYFELAWRATAGLRNVFMARMVGPDVVRGSNNTALRADVIRLLRENAERAGTPSHGAAALAQAIEADDATEAKSAIDAYRTGPRFVDLLRALSVAAEIGSRTGARTEAQDWLAEARAGWETLGADRELERLAAAATALDATSSPRRARSRIGWESLSPMELEVASLVVAGLTNRQIGERLHISRRTAETHLAHIFTKLGVTTRAQVAAEAARRMPD